MQEPQEVHVGQPEYSPQFSGCKRRLVQVCDTYQYIPLLPSLQELLSDASVLEQVETCAQRVHTNGQIEDFCDGTIFSKHPIFSRLCKL